MYVLSRKITGSLYAVAGCGNLDSSILLPAINIKPPLHYRNAFFRAHLYTHTFLAFGFCVIIFQPNRKWKKAIARRSRVSIYLWSRNYCHPNISVGNICRINFIKLEIVASRGYTPYPLFHPRIAYTRAKYIVHIHKHTHICIYVYISLLAHGIRTRSA